MAENLPPPAAQADDLRVRVEQLDLDALEELHDSYYPAALAYLSFRIHDSAACLALADQLFVELLAALQRKHGLAPNLPGWLFTAAARLADGYLRRNLPHPGNNIGVQLPALWKRPPGAAPPRLEPAQVQHALQRLNPDQQHILALRFANRFSVAEIAQVTGRTVKAIQELQFASLAELSEVLHDEVA